MSQCWREAASGGQLTGESFCDCPFPSGPCAKAATPAKTIDTEVWIKDPDRPGYLKLERTRTVREVYEMVRDAVGEYPHGGEEYLSLMPRDALRGWPQGRIVVFSVNGSSEGDYVHVEVHGHEDKRELLILAKTFAGRDASWWFARRLADLLGA